MGSRSKSLGYALRNAFGRISGNIKKGVDIFIVQSEFQKHKFTSQGIPVKKIGILAGISPHIEDSDSNHTGEWVSFVGRVSAEKGIYEFIEAARMNLEIPFKVAGNLDENFKMPENLPANLEFVGFKKGKELDKFYIDSRIIVVPSKWYEGFPNVIVRGMLHSKPIITSNVGAMQSIIDNERNGLLISPGSVHELTIAIRKIYFNSDICQSYGKNGFKKASTLYSREKIYQDLMHIYKRAINISQNNLSIFS